MVDLAPLAENDNVGGTWTHALRTGSAGIDAIPDVTNGCVSGTSVDQRGAARLEVAGEGDDFCDIGAYEYGATVPTSVELLQLVAGKAPGAAAAGLAAMLGGQWAMVRRRRRAAR